jgi:AraC family transcriptional regulator
LKAGGTAVTQIALEAGYGTHAAFSRAFRDRFGESPSRYRELNRKVTQSETGKGVPDGHGLANGVVLNTTRIALDVRLVDRPDTRVAFVRHVGPYAEMGAAWKRLIDWAEPRGLLGPKPECIGLSRDDPEVTPPNKLRYDACIAVGPAIRAEGDVGLQLIVGGPYAVATHRGPVERLPETYAAVLGRWLPAHNRRPRSAPCFEVYKKIPTTMPPEQLVTDVYVPLEP